MKNTLKFLLIFSIISTQVLAQKNNIAFTLGVGNAFTGLRTKEFSNNLNDFSDKVSANNRFNTALNMGLFYNININKSFTVQVGAQYQRRNLFIQRKIIESQSSIYEYSMFTTNTRLNYLNFPALFSVKIYEQEKHKLLIGAGMVYGFLLSGESDLAYQIKYKDGRLSQRDENKNQKVRQALIQTENPTEGTFNSFDTGLRAQLSYVYNHKWCAQLSFDYSLYDVYLVKNSGWNPVKTRQLALSIGYQLF